MGMIICLYMTKLHIHLYVHVVTILLSGVGDLSGGGGGGLIRRRIGVEAIIVSPNIHHRFYGLVISRGAEGPGREILQRPPSVCLSVRPSVCPSRLVFAL